VRVDVPREDEAIRRLVRDDTRPLTLGAVDAAVVHATSGAWLEHRLRDVDAEHVVLPRLDLIELLREDLERSLERRVHDDLGLHGGVRCGADHASSSTSALKLVSVWLQNRSS
jgi:hypothetical protein